VLSQRVRRIIEANRAEKRIRHLAYNDLLTGLPNRTLFFELLGQSIEHARPPATSWPCCSWTWTASSTSTTTSATTWATACWWRWRSACAARVRNVDAVARLGGDEFTVVLTNSTARPRRCRRRA
jgi:GGDEF domain-containing protein